MTRVIGLVGRTGAGQHTAAEYLSSRHGAPLFEVAEHGERGIAENVAERIAAAQAEVVAVTGIRTPEEADVLRTRFARAFTLVSIDGGDERHRFERTAHESVERAPDRFDRFRRSDEEDNEHFHLGETIASADVALDNRAAVDVMFEQLEKEIMRPVAREEAREARQERLVRWLEDIGSADTADVGGKNSSLGEMLGKLSSAGIRVPGGFATTALAYWRFLESGGLEARLRHILEDHAAGRASLGETGSRTRAAFLNTPFPEDLADAIRSAYRAFSLRVGRDRPDVAVRSSATAEDLPEASFAGQQESYLNICGQDALLEACRRCYASLFTRDLVPRTARLRSHEGGALDRRPGDGAVRSGRRGRPLHARYRHGLPAPASDQRRLGPGRERRPGSHRAR